VTKDYSENLEEIVTFGFDAIDSDEKVEVNLKDLMYVFSTLQEYQRFFHQRSHYDSVDDVQRFLGTSNGLAGYKLLHTSIHEKMRKMIPSHVGEKYDEGDFDSPRLPFYYDKNS